MDDESLLKLAQAGDNSAANTLLVKYIPLVYSVCQDKYLPGADHEDLMQEGLMGVMDAIKDYRTGEGCFSSFVMLCVNRKIADALKIANRKKHGPLNTYVSLQANVGDEDGITYEDEIAAPDDVSEVLSPEDILIRQEDESTLDLRLKKLLTPLELNVLLGILDGRSYSEIAEKYEISEKSVDNARQRIKNKILKSKLI